MSCKCKRNGNASTVVEKPFAAFAANAGKPVSDIEYGDSAFCRACKDAAPHNFMAVDREPKITLLGCDRSQTPRAALVELWERECKAAEEAATRMLELACWQNWAREDNNK